MATLKLALSRRTMARRRARWHPMEELILILGGYQGSGRRLAGVPAIS